MDDRKKQLTIFGKGGSGGGGAATWGQITGTLSDQTDLQNALNAKADSSSVPTSTSDLTNDSGFRTVVEINDMTQAELLDFYTNYATRLTENTYVMNGYTFSIKSVTNQHGTVLVLESNARYFPNGNTVDVTVDLLYVFANGQTQAYSDVTYNVPLSSGLATVATSGSYNDLSNKPAIPTVNDATITLQDDGGTTIDSFTLNQSSNKTITIPSGGGSQWFGTQAQFEALGTYDEDTDYYISDKLDYNTDLKNKPDLSVYPTKTEVNTKNLQQDFEIAGKLSGHFMTQAEFDQITPLEGQNYFIEGNTVEMVVTFTDQTTATYNVVVD